MRQASSSTGLIVKAIVALAWLAVLLASDDAGAVSVAAARPIRTDVGREFGSWPEVVGMTSPEAKKIICGHGSSCDRVHVIPVGAYVTMNYDIRRVRIFVDSNDKVALVPRVG